MAVAKPAWLLRLIEVFVHRLDGVLADRRGHPSDRAVPSLGSSLSLSQAHERHDASVPSSAATRNRDRHARPRMIGGNSVHLLGSRSVRDGGDC
jgi:hypothetical protein